MLAPQPKLIPIIIAFAMTGLFALTLPMSPSGQRAPFSTLDQTLHDLNASGLIAGNQL